MTRHDEDLEQVLRPWMHRHAPDAPNELVLRITGEIEAMSERAPTQSWLSRFAAWPAAAWAATAVAVAVIAVAGGFFLTNLLGTPSVGNVATMSPAPTQPPSTATAVADGLIAAWNAGDGQQAVSLYSTAPIVRFIINNESVTDSYLGSANLSSAVSAWHAQGSALTRTGDVLTQGPFAAFPVTWTTSGGSASGVEVLRISADGLVSEEYRIGVTPVVAPGTITQADAAQLVRKLRDAENGADEPAAASLLATTFQGSIFRDTSSNPMNRGDFLGSISAGQACCESDTGSVLTQGPFIVHTVTVTQATVQIAGVQVIEVNSVGQIQFIWRVVTTTELAGTPAPAASGG